MLCFSTDSIMVYWLPMGCKTDCASPVTPRGNRTLPALRRCSAPSLPFSRRTTCPAAVFHLRLEIKTHIEKPHSPITAFWNTQVFHSNFLSQNYFGSKFFRLSNCALFTTQKKIGDIWCRVLFLGAVPAHTLQTEFVSRLPTDEVQRRIAQKLSLASFDLSEATTGIRSGAMVSKWIFRNLRFGVFFPELRAPHISGGRKIPILLYFQNLCYMCHVIFCIYFYSNFVLQFLRRFFPESPHISGGGIGVEGLAAIGPLGHPPPINLHGLKKTRWGAALSAHIFPPEFFSRELSFCPS